MSGVVLSVHVSGVVLTVCTCTFECYLERKSNDQKKNVNFPAVQHEVVMGGLRTKSVRRFRFAVRTELWVYVLEKQTPAQNALYYHYIYSSECSRLKLDRRSIYDKNYIIHHPVQHVGRTT